MAAFDGVCGVVNALAILLGSLFELVTGPGLASRFERE